MLKGPIELRFARRRTPVETGASGGREYIQILTIVVLRKKRPA
jgi:hypothetical protein